MAEIPSKETTQAYQQWKQVLENQTTPKEYKTSREVEKERLQPKFIEISPLKRRISVSFFNEDYQNIFTFLALQAGLSFILDPDLNKYVPPEKSKITFQFLNQPIEDIIKKICEILDLYPKIEKGILYLQPFEERIFNLGFLPVVKESTSQLGGDVLGNVGTGGGGLSSPLKGEFSVTAQLSRDYLEVYTNLEETISTLLSDKGLYQLNKAAGILYVKDRPSKVRALEAFLEKFKAKYKKQIILDAQIIEIELTKGHSLGIDWFEITNYLMGNNRVEFNTLDLNLTTRENQPSFSLTISGQPNINLILNLLKQYGELKILQNPKLRVLHSQPAIISVGTTFSYIKEVKREVPTGGPTSTVTYTTQTSSVFDGILIGIVPYLTENNEVYLHIVPIKSELLDLKDVRFGPDYTITLPTVNLRELTSIVRSKPGDLVVIGGLILDKDKNAEKRLAAPVLDRVFRMQTGSSKLAELVIIIRVLVD